MEIKAAVARQVGGALSIESLDIEKPRAHEVRVRVVATGVCHTDMVVRDGHLPTPMPVVLGHEGAGVVESVGSAVTKVAVGDHVVMTFNSCGGCPSCADGEPAYCHEFFPRNFFATRPDGSSGLAKGSEKVHGNFFGQSSFASLALAHERNVVKVRQDVPLELLGPLGCGVLTGAGAIMNSLKVTAGKSLAVFGTGSVGLSAVMAAKALGATTIIAVDMNDERLAFARSVGATHAINPKATPDVVAAVMAITGSGVNFSLDTTGLMPVVRNAVLCLAPRGACGILGAAPMGTELNLDEVHFMSGGRRLIGIVEGSANPDTFIPTLVDLYAGGLFPFDRMVKFYPFEQINQAIADSESGRTIKPIVRMG
jgi:aryl-alcohol dehydrogenase